MLEIIPCKNMYRLINENRRFTITVAGKESRCRILNNGLPLGSVLSTLLFNLKASDLLSTVSRKFSYTDDLALATQNNKIEITKDTLIDYIYYLSTLNNGNYN